MNTKVTLAVVGSREFCDWDTFLEATTRWMIDVNGGRFPDKVVSGGARGADTMAEKWANQNGIETCIFGVTRQDWERNPKTAGLIRNTLIVNQCTHVLAFPKRGDDGKPVGGTRDTIQKALRAGKHVLVI